VVGVSKKINTERIPIIGIRFFSLCCRSVEEIFSLFNKRGQILNKKRDIVTDYA